MPYWSYLELTGQKYFSDNFSPESTIEVNSRRRYIDPANVKGIYDLSRVQPCRK